MGGRTMKKQVEIPFFYHSAPHRSAQDSNHAILIYPLRMQTEE